MHTTSTVWENNVLLIDALADRCLHAADDDICNYVSRLTYIIEMYDSSSTVKRIAIPNNLEVQQIRHPPDVSVETVGLVCDPTVCIIGNVDPRSVTT